MALAHADTAPPGVPPPGQPDQVNTAPWDRAWTNLLNDAEQSFVPALPVLTAVEVQLVVGNPGKKKDRLTLAVLDSSARTLVVISQYVLASEADHVAFLMPDGGIRVTPGESYNLKLTGGATFGWKYVVGGYENGAATFNRKPLLRQTRSTFLFTTFGSN